MKTVDHHREEIYKHESSAFTEVIQWFETLTFSSNWFWASGFESHWSKLFVTFNFFSFFLNLFFTLFFICAVHIASNTMG